MQTVDSGLKCLVAIAEHFGIPADLRQLERAYIVDKKNVDTVGVMRAAKDLKLRVRLLESVLPEKMGGIPLPAILPLKNGSYIVLLKLNAEKALVYDPLTNKPPFVTDVKILWEHWENKIILFAKRFELESKFKKFGFSWFIPIIQKYKRFFFEVLGISLILQLFGLITPLFTQVIIDKVLVHRSVNTLDVLLGGMVVVAIFQNWIMGLRTYLFTHTTNKIDVSLSSEMFKKITELPVKYFEKWQVGEVVSRVGELENIRSFMTGSALTVILDIVFAVVYLVVMYVYSNVLSVVVWVTIPMFLVLNLIVAPIYKRKINERFLLGAENQSFTIETITGIRTLKSLAVEHQFIRRYEEILARYVKSVFSVINLANIAGSIGSFLEQGFNLAILWIGAYYVMENDLSVGELIAFQMLAGQVISPILRLVNMWQYFQQTRVSMERLGDVMDCKSEPAFNPNRTTLPSLTGEVIFNKVDFSYKEEGKKVLSDISIRIPAGFKVGIVGRSGSGKSTLTKLMQRLYIPDNGSVMIDGVDLAQVEPAWLRRQIGIVLQENFLFSGTIKENIAIAMPNATDEQIMLAAKLAGADEFIQEMPHQYETFVGERGSLLSGGQKQRISIARALLLDPKILIFDEATSALDYESEKIIMDNLDKITEGRTTIMIAHRLSTVRNCEAILMMDKGRIIECGTHTELMNRQGAYYQLYSSQE